MEAKLSKMVELLAYQNELLEGVAAALIATHKQEAQLMEKLLGMEEKPPTFENSISAMHRMAGLADSGAFSDSSSEARGEGNATQGADEEL